MKSNEKDGTTMKVYKQYPYNDFQKQFHIPEAVVRRNMRLQAKHQAKNPVHEETLYQEKLAFLEEIKNQDPHPAKVFDRNAGCFWDTDVYWLHWQKNKPTIIERVIRFFSHGKGSYEEQFNKSLTLLDQFYTKEDILDVIGHTTNFFIDIETRKKIFRHYGAEQQIRTFKWGFVENLRGNKR